MHDILFAAKRYSLEKPSAILLLIALVTSLLTSLAIVPLWQSYSAADEQLDRLGNTLARALADLSMEAALDQDRMKLAVLANRVAKLPDVARVAVFSTSNELLADSGTATPGTREHNQSIIIDGNVSGYVRVAMYPATNTAPPILPLWLASFALILLPVVAVVLATHVSTAPPSTLQDQTQSVPVMTMSDEVMAARGRAVLVANLQNTLATSREDRDGHLARGLALAREVCTLYPGEADVVPGRGIIITFARTHDGDQPYQVVCAAFLLMNLVLAENEAGEDCGAFRLSCHLIDSHTRTTTQHSDDSDDPDSRLDRTPVPDSDTLDDLLLLASLAGEDAVAATDRFFQDVRHAERLTAERFNNPLLDDVGLARDGVMLIHDIASNHRILVRQQADLLLYPDENPEDDYDDGLARSFTPKESTF